MSTQQAEPTLKPQKPSLDLILKYEFIPCLIEFLKKGDQTIRIDGFDYQRLEIEKGLLAWLGRHPELNISPESVNFENSQSLEQLDQAITNHLREQCEKKYGSAVPENLEDLVAAYAVHLEKQGKQGALDQTKGVETEALPSLEAQIKLALEIQQRLKLAANKKLPEDYVKRVIREKTPEVLKKAVEHYQQGQPLNEQALEQIIKDIKDLEFQFVLSGKTEEKQPRIRTAARAIGIFVADSRNKDDLEKALVSQQKYQASYNLERGTKAGLEEFLAKEGFEPTKIRRIPNFLESLNPAMPKEEVQERLRHYFRINHSAELAKRGLTPREFVFRNFAAFETFIQHSPLTVQKDSQGESLYLPTAAIIRQANISGDSPISLTAYTYGITPQIIEQEFQRKDLSIAEKKRLKELQEDLNNIINREKTEPKLKEEVKQAQKQSLEYCQTHQLWKPDNPNRISFFRPPPAIAMLSLTQFKKQAVAYGLFGRLPNLTKVPALKRLKLIKKFSLKYWKKTAAFGIGRRVIGSLLIRSGQRGLVGIGRTIISQGFRMGIKRGARILGFLAKQVGAKILIKVGAYLGGLLSGIFNFGTSTAFTLLLIAKDIVGLIFGGIKNLLGLGREKPEKLEDMAVAVFKGRGGLLWDTIKQALSPRERLAELGEVGFAISDLFSLKNIATTATIVVIALIFLLVVVLNPLTSAFVAFPGGRGGSSLERPAGTSTEIPESALPIAQSLYSSLQQCLGSEQVQITAANANDVYNCIVQNTSIPNRQAVAQYIRDSALRNEDLQCVGFVQALTLAIHGINLETRNAIDYLDPNDIPAGFQKPTDYDQVGPGAIGIVPPAPGLCLLGENCTTNINCCGHMYIYVADGWIAEAWGKGTGGGGTIDFRKVPESYLPLQNYLIPY